MTYLCTFTSKLESVHSEYEAKNIQTYKNDKFYLKYTHYISLKLTGPKTATGLKINVIGDFSKNGVTACINFNKRTMQSFSKRFIKKNKLLIWSSVFESIVICENEFQIHTASHWKLNRSII